MHALDFALCIKRSTTPNVKRYPDANIANQQIMIRMPRLRNDVHHGELETNILSKA